VLSLDGARPDLQGTPAARMQFTAPAEADRPAWFVRRTGADGTALPPTPIAAGADLAGHLGGAVTAGEAVVGIYCRSAARSPEPSVLPLDLLPADLRPR
jgi:hypothetical protein